MVEDGQGELRGRTALITGASRGIGRAVAEALTAAGARVLLVARGADALADVARATGGTALVGDVAREEDVARIARAAGAPDIVVHAAGAFQLARLEDTSTQLFDAMIDVNLRAAFLLMRAVLPAMVQRGSGHIVSIGSVAGRQAFPANGAYAASKFGLRGLHAVLDAETRGTGVRSTLIEPAATDTGLWDAVDRERHTGLPEASAMLAAEHVARAVLFALTQPADVAIRNVILERS